MKLFFQGLFSSFLWRQSLARLRGRRRSLLIQSCILAFTMALVVFLQSFKMQIDEMTEKEKSSFLGADFVIKSRQAIDKDSLDYFQERLGAEAVEERRFASMARFVKKEGRSQGRLVQVRAVDMAYPLRGHISFLSLANAPPLEVGTCYIDAVLALQFRLLPSDEVVLGKKSFVIGAVMKSLPGEVAALGELAPKILINKQDLAATKLMGFGARVFYRYNYRWPEENFNQNGFLKNLKTDFPRLSYESTADDSMRMMRVLEDLLSFMQIFSLVLFLLAAIVMANAAYLHLHRQAKDLLILRSLGLNRGQIKTAVCIESVLLVSFSLVLSLIFLVPLQLTWQEFFVDFSPVDLKEYSAASAWIMILKTSIVVAFVTGVLYTIFSLLALKRTGVLASQDLNRVASLATTKLSWRLKALVFFLTLGACLSFFFWQGEDLRAYLAFAGILLALLVIFSLAQVLLFCLRKLTPFAGSFVSRHALKNLFRPGNQSLLLLVLNSFAVFLLAFLYFSEQALARKLEASQQEGKANLILFDIQNEQRESLDKIVAQQKGLKPVEDLALVNFRLKSINGRGVDEILAEPDNKIPKWTLQRVYRSTYRAHLSPGEEIIEGDFIGHYEMPKNEEDLLVPISLEEGIAEKLQVSLGAQLLFDLEGMPIPCEVASIRKVDWLQMRPNFFVLFPEGFLDDAPQMSIKILNLADEQGYVKLQDSLAKADLTNISAINLTELLGTLQKLFAKLASLVQWISYFCLFFAALVFVNSLYLSQEQRRRENALLKALGASDKKILLINYLEFLSLLFLSCNLGLFLAYLIQVFLQGQWVFLPIGKILLVGLLTQVVFLLLAALCLAIFCKRNYGHETMKYLAQD